MSDIHCLMAARNATRPPRAAPSQSEYRFQAGSKWSGGSGKHLLSCHSASNSQKETDPRTRTQLKKQPHPHRQLSYPCLPLHSHLTPPTDRLTNQSVFLSNHAPTHTSVRPSYLPLCLDGTQSLVQVLGRLCCTLSYSSLSQPHYNTSIHGLPITGFFLGQTLCHVCARTVSAR